MFRFFARGIGSAILARIPIFVKSLLLIPRLKQHDFQVFRGSIKKGLRN